MIEQPAARPGTVPAIAIAFLCGVALPIGAALVALITGFVGAELADTLNLGGDSDAFGDGADGFVVGAFIGFLATFVAGGFFIALATSREFAVRLVVPLLAVFAPVACVLLLLIAAF